jgi:hypothetical protein
MPERKELDFFVAEHNWERGRGWYEGWFEGAGDARAAIGEASPRYTMYPSYAGVPARMSEMLPEAKLVYVVRDPIARMISHYQQMARRGRVEMDAAKTLLTEPDLVNASRYGLQLERYLEHFPRDQILVVVTEQLRQDRRGTINQIFAFLGLDAARSPGDFAEEYNATAGQEVPRSFLRPLMKLGSWNQVVPALPASVKATGRRFTHRPQHQVTVSADVRRELEARLRDDVAVLRSYMPPGFDGWGIA